MKKHNLILVFVILFSTILSTTSYLVYTNDFTQNKDELVSESDKISSKKTYPTINKALPIDTTTIYSGEDVYIDFANTTKIYVESTYQYNSINNLTHNISIRVTEPTVNQVHMNVPDGWNFSSIIPSETMEYNITGNDYDFTPSQAPGSILYNVSFLSGTTYGRLTTRQNQYLTIDEFNDDLDVDGSFDVTFAGDFTRSNNLTNLSIQNEPVYSGNGSMCIIESSENDILFSQIGYEPPGVENNEEWIEVYNNGISPINLGDWTISDNSLTYTIVLGTVLASQENIVFAKSTAGFNALFGFNPDFGDLSLSLDNNGDELVLAHSNSTEIDYVAWEGFNATWDIFADSNNTITRNLSISDTDTESDWLSNTTARPTVGGLDGDISTGITPNQNFDDGFYYLSFVHLFETFTSGTVKLQWFDGESKEYVLNTSFPYWQSEFLLIHINGNTTWKNMLLNFTTSGEFVFYLDEFKIWRVNPLIIPTNIIHQYNISSSLISWDLRQNFGVNNERVDYNITLTNTNSNQNSTSLTTDANGFSSYIYVNKTLDEAQLTVSTNSAYYFVYNTFNNLQESEVLRTNMNTGSGATLFDQSSNGFDGTIDGAGWVSSDVQGNGLDFELGNTDFIDFGDESLFDFTSGGQDQPFSISCYFQIESVGTDQILIGKHNSAGNRGWRLYLAGGTDLTFNTMHADGLANIGVTYSVNLVIDTWYHVVSTYDGSEVVGGMNLFLNGTEVDDNIIGGGVYTGLDETTATVLIGSRNIGAHDNFDGIIDELRVYDKELSQSEINYLFQPDQQFQCQPRQIDERHFSYETKTDGSLNEWDFKEGTNESLIVSQLTGTDELSVENGYFRSILASGTFISTRYKVSTTNINADIYNMIEIRIWVNATLPVPQIFFKDNSVNIVPLTTITANTWQILTLTPTDDWSGIETEFHIGLFGDRAGALEFRVDYIRLIRPITTVITSNDPFWIINSLDDSFSYVFNVTYAGDSIRSGTVVDNVRQVSKQNGNTVINAIAIQDTSYPNECLLPCDLVTKTITTKGVEMVDETQYWVNIISMLILLIVIFIGIAMFKLYWRTVK